MATTFAKIGGFGRLIALVALSARPEKVRCDGFIVVAVAGVAAAVSVSAAVCCVVAVVTFVFGVVVLAGQCAKIARQAIARAFRVRWNSLYF